MRATALWLHLCCNPPPVPTSASPQKTHRLSANTGTVAGGEGAERAGRPRREVISAVSPQRFPHSTLISSNNVSQTSQLFRRDGGWKEVRNGGQGGGECVPFSSLLFHTINLSFLTVVSKKSDYGDLIVSEELLYCWYLPFAPWKCTMAASNLCRLGLEDDV